MKTYIVTVIYENADPVAYVALADTRKDALRMAWDKYDQVADHIRKIVAVLK